MPPGRRQLFIYWRVASADLPMALQTVRDWQTSLKVRHPELRCGLYQRSDAAKADATLMETYWLVSTVPTEGIGTTLQQHIDESGNAVLQPWLRGARHVEVFDTLSD